MGLPLEFRRIDGFHPPLLIWLSLLLVVWDKRPQCQIFLKEEAEANMNIPLSPNLPQNRIIWIGPKSGMFSVKSAYHIGRVLKEDPRGQYSYADRMPDM